tara:strand:+ start:541 stop:2733 length:2193 start_codon:yes stop_codon:yes gene_type:complete
MNNAAPQALTPKISLTNFGLPWYSIDEANFEKYCDKILQFITNSKVSTAYFHIGDYVSDAHGAYNHVDPNPPSDSRKDGGDGEITPWIVTYFLNKLPDNVEAGVIPYTNPKYPWHIYDAEATGKDVDPIDGGCGKSLRNCKDNITIGDGKTKALDNMHQVFMMIENLNKAAQSSKPDGTKFTRLEFDHEGGGEYQEDTPYGLTNEAQPGKNPTPANSVGVGYVKWLWNEYMPEEATKYSHKQADPKKLSDFKGHYPWGFINYRTNAWQEKSAGSIDAFAENYWFGELEFMPGNFKLEDKITEALKKDNARDEVLATFTKLNTITEALGDNPETTLKQSDGTIRGGGTSLNWAGHKEVDKDDQPDNIIFAPQAIDTVYRYYRDYPEALAEIFANPDYPSGGKPSAATCAHAKEGEDCKGWGPPHLSESYYQPIDKNQANVNPDTPQGGIPTFSIENLSSTNQSRVKDSDRITDRIKSKISDSVITATLKDMEPESMNDLNSKAGTFDGLSALDYNEFIQFLNKAAEIIAAESDDLNPEDVTLSIYEAPFIPMSWVEGKVSNHWESKTIQGSSSEHDILIGQSGKQTLLGLAGNDFLDGRKGYDHLFGGKGADTFYFKPSRQKSNANKKHDVISDFDHSEKDTISIDHKSSSNSQKDITLLKTKSANISKLSTNIADVIYNKNTGEMHFNANGTKPGLGRQGGLLAILEGAPNLKPSSINFYEPGGADNPML